MTSPYNLTGTPLYAFNTPTPVSPAMQTPPAYLPRMEIAKVAGIDSAKAFSIGPNSSAILMDMNEPLIYVIVTDASGYKTVTPFVITEQKQEAPLQASDLNARFDAIDKRLDSIEERMKSNAQSNYKSSWPNKQPTAESGSNSPGSANRQ